MFKQSVQTQSKTKEQTGYMTELDAWVEHFVIKPLHESWRNQDIAFADPHGEETVKATVATVRKSIRDKVLESYRNGQAAGPRREFQRR